VCKLECKKKNKKKKGNSHNGNKKKSGNQAEQLKSENSGGKGCIAWRQTSSCDATGILANRSTTTCPRV
jgi:hypothetical protein